MDTPVPVIPAAAKKKTNTTTTSSMHTPSHLCWEILLSNPCTAAALSSWRWILILAQVNRAFRALIQPDRWAEWMCLNSFLIKCKTPIEHFSMPLVPGKYSMHPVSVISRVLSMSCNWKAVGRARKFRRFHVSQIHKGYQNPITDPDQQCTLIVNARDIPIEEIQALEEIFMYASRNRFRLLQHEFFRKCLGEMVDELFLCKKHAHTQLFSCDNNSTKNATNIANILMFAARYSVIVCWTTK